jgi:hypothetical protein
MSTTPHAAAPAASEPAIANESPLPHVAVGKWSKTGSNALAVQ